MNTKSALYSLLVALVALPIFGSAPAHAAPGGCTVIPYLPYTIQQPGCYCLAQNFSMALGSGTAITVDSDDVIVDFDGYTIDNRSAGSTTSAKGVYSNDRTDVTVRNGVLRGFYRGVSLYASSATAGLTGLVVEDLVVTDSKNAGIVLFGSYGGVVRGNTVLTTSGGAAYDTTDTYGIYVVGPNAWVHDNAVAGTSAKSGTWASGIRLNTSAHGVVERNKISNNVLTSNSYGISGVTSDNFIVTENRVANVTYGIHFNSSTGKYRENVTSGCTAAFTGGTDAGNNY